MDARLDKLREEMEIHHATCMQAIGDLGKEFNKEREVMATERKTYKRMMGLVEEVHKKMVPGLLEAQTSTLGGMSYSRSSERSLT